MDLNQTYFFYGYSAAWLIVLGFILILIRRGQQINSELQRLKALVEDKDK